MSIYYQPTIFISPKVPHHLILIPVHSSYTGTNLKRDSMPTSEMKINWHPFILNFFVLIYNFLILIGHSVFKLKRLGNARIWRRLLLVLTNIWLHNHFLSVDNSEVDLNWIKNVILCISETLEVHNLWLWNCT